MAQKSSHHGSPRVLHCAAHPNSRSRNVDTVVADICDRHRFDFGQSVDPLQYKCCAAAGCNPQSIGCTCASKPSSSGPTDGCGTQPTELCAAVPTATLPPALLPPLSHPQAQSRRCED
eukprot:4161996-Prymnesium_polylepis.2